MKKWLAYTILTSFSVYWFSNLFLWYPWSYSTTLGILLMLTVSPFIWAFACYVCFIYSPHNKRFSSAGYIAFIMLIIAVLSDHIFFGIIRKAMEELYHPTTLYGYGFVITLPFILSLIFRKRIDTIRRTLRIGDFLWPGIVGLISFATIFLIIQLEA